MTRTWPGRTVFKDFLLLLQRCHLPGDAAGRRERPHAPEPGTRSQTRRFVVKSFASLGRILEYVAQEEAVEASKYIHGARKTKSTIKRYRFALAFPDHVLLGVDVIQGASKVVEEVPARINPYK